MLIAHYITLEKQENYAVLIFKGQLHECRIWMIWEKRQHQEMFPDSLSSEWELALNNCCICFLSWK